MLFKISRSLVLPMAIGTAGGSNFYHFHYWEWFFFALILDMAHFVYIIHSQSIDRNYIGETHDLEERLDAHNSGKYDHSFTKQSSDWRLIWSLELPSRSSAINIEQHIKRMKSRKYIENLIAYPEIADKLIHKYAIQDQ